MINVKSKKSIGISCNTTSDKVGKVPILFSYDLKVINSSVS
jgi:hypothetical protein